MWYIDDTSKDEDLFEFGDYAEITKPQAVSIFAMVLIHGFVIVLLVAAPSGRITKKSFTMCFEYALLARPARIVQAKVTRKELVNLVSTQVDQWLIFRL